MRLDLRTTIASVWLTLGLAITTTTLVYTHNLQTTGLPPADLQQARLIVLGMWWGAFLCGFLPALMFWTGGKLTQAMSSSTFGYLTGTFIHLMFLKLFLPGASRGFNLFWNLFTLRGIPSYHIFVLLVIIGGSLMACLGVLIAQGFAGNLPPERSRSTLSFVRGLMIVSAVAVALLGGNVFLEGVDTWQPSQPIAQSLADSLRSMNLPDHLPGVERVSFLLHITLNSVLTLLLILIPYRSGLVYDPNDPLKADDRAADRYVSLVEPRALVATLSITLLVLLIAMFIGNNYTQPPTDFLSGEGGKWMLSLLTGSQLPPTDNFTLRNIDWLVMPQINMIIAAVVGFLVGLSYFAPDRNAAAATVTAGLCLHVVIMLLLDPIAAAYDPLHGGLDPTQVVQTSFRYFWYGTPAVGGIAAYAMHNLRDAFEMPPAEDEALPPIPMTEGA